MTGLQWHPFCGGMGAVADIGNMGAEEVYDLLRDFMLLGDQKAVVEDPVISLAVLVFGA